ncbi:hypothetical protein B9479_003667 [Cryptococcus floricola]|uniref:Transmembrane protein n=1 Tax=Cryptococcus floricola TaxID=2591691 RepID=A0A5D3AW45_9TREE|nr:hypothetical protein B9479_003667 [Cryptococcus floricola]
MAPTHLPPPLSPTPSLYAAAENGTSTSTGPLSPGLRRTPSPSPTRSRFGDEDGRDGEHGIHMERSSSGMNRGGGRGEASGWSGLTPQRIGRAIGARFMRAVKRGNLPFLIVFFSCTIVFFSALAGVGYVEPAPSDALDIVAAAPSSGAEVPEYKFGGPVFDPVNDRQRLERKMAEQRALEEAWARKKRPKDGAWMRKQRDDKAVRRVPTPASTKAAEALETLVAEIADTGADGAEGIDLRQEEAKKA